MAKRAQKVQRYKVLKPVSNDKTGERFDVGETVTDQDFKKVIIKGWLESSPPVLEEV